MALSTVRMGATEEVFSSTVSHTHITRVANAISTPPVDTPSHRATPPPATVKRASERTTNRESNGQSDRGAGMPNNDAIDPSALSKALKDFEDAGRHRDITPGGSPSRKRQRVYGDR